jgi:sugar lactone lactonase YvrE
LKLAAADRWEVHGIGPEDVVIDRAGAVVAGLEDGRLVRFAAGGGSPEVLANVGGRPLGIELYGDDLLVCNADLGLQLISPTGAVENLVRSYEGRPLLFTNNAAVASNGTIYFTDTSTRWTIHEYLNDLLEGRRTGRVFRRGPNGDVDVLIDGLAFANGLALADGESELYVAETARYRIHRHHLTGPHAGSTEVFADNLPGFPDNLTHGNDTLWMGAPSPRQAIVDVLLPRPRLRHLSHRLPESMKPKPMRHGMVLGFDGDGNVTHNLQDASGSVAITTSARWHDGRLFVGTLTEPYLAVIDV